MHYDITIVGAGYVGLSLGVLLAQNHSVTILESDSEKVDMINRGISPLKERAIAEQLQFGALMLSATTSLAEAYQNADFAIVAVPTNYNEETGMLDTSIMDEVIDIAIHAFSGTIVIKSTSPIGYAKKKNEEYCTQRILFSPEFLREGRALYDCHFPARIVAGGDGVAGRQKAKEFALLLRSVSENKPMIYVTGTAEAEAAKMFANAYLAMRVAFFNELDSFAEDKGMDSKEILEVVCSDSRIGFGYANPSFGYGGYCLPKDTRHLAGELKFSNNADLLRAVPVSNTQKIQHVAQKILETGAKTVGLYGIAMKAGSDNARSASVLQVADILERVGKEVIVRKTKVDCPELQYPVVEEDEFWDRAEAVLINRISQEKLESLRAMYPDKIIYTRDVFGGD